MKTYLLPCSCGQKLEVDASQAGLAVTCDCGQTLDVPTMRGLAQLETVERASLPEETAAAGGSAWGPAQGMLFLGGLLTLLGLAATYYVYSWRPRVDINVPLIRADMDLMTPEQSLEIWEEFRKGLQRGPTGLSQEYEAAVTTYHRYLGFAIAPLAVGVLLLATGAMLKLRPAVPA